MTMYLGIDVGTSGVRAMVIDGDLTVQFETSCSFDDIAPAQRATHWRTQVFDRIRQIPVALRAQLAAMAIDGTSSTVFLCDAAGHPLHPPRMYNDTCSVGTLQQLAQMAPPGHTVRSASSSLAKILDLTDQIDWTPGRYVLHQADWLAACFHGQWGYSDYHNSLKLGYDPEIDAYPDWFDHPQLRGLRPHLPEVVAPGTVLGEVQGTIAQALGLPSTCQVCAGTTDSIAAFLASDATAPGEAVTSLGSTLVLKLLSRTRVDYGAEGIYSHRLGEYWLVGGASNTGGAVLQHYFTPDQLRQFSLQIDPTQASPLNYYPLLKPGERFPINDRTLQPRLSPRPADPVAFLHGLLESLARIEAQGYALLQARGATPMTQIYTAGGGAQNLTWQAIRQRHLQVPFLEPRHCQAAYGAALLAAQANLA